MIPYKEIIGSISDIEPIAVNTSIDDLDRLRKLYGRGRWRKLKGKATGTRQTRLEEKTSKSSVC